MILKDKILMRLRVRDETYNSKEHVSDKWQTAISHWMDCLSVAKKKKKGMVPHDRLHVEIGNCWRSVWKATEWMESCLVGRKMRSVIKDKFSSWRNV